MNLHRPIRRLATETIRPIITHTHLMAQLPRDLLRRCAGVHFRGGFEDQQLEHLALRGELHDWELNRLVGGEGLAEGGTLAGVEDRLVDAVLGCAEGGGGLA
jgi:hypothetical protein